MVGYSRGSNVAARLLAMDSRKQVSKAVLGGIGLDFTNPNWPRRLAIFTKPSPNPAVTPNYRPWLRTPLKSGADTVALKFQQQAQPYTSPVELASVKIPVLVICGTEDADNGSASELASLLPNATLVSGSGYARRGPEYAPEFAEKVAGFPEELKAGAIGTGNSSAGLIN